MPPRQYPDERPPPPMRNNAPREGRQVRRCLNRLMCAWLPGGHPCGCFLRYGTYLVGVRNQARVLSVRQVVVQGLLFTAGWQELKDLTRPFGSVARADIAVGPDGRSKGWGTVLFDDPRDAQAAINVRCPSLGGLQTSVGGPAAIVTDSLCAALRDAVEVLCLQRCDPSPERY